MSDERYSYQQKFVKLSENWRKRDCGFCWFVCLFVFAQERKKSRARHFLADGIHLEG